MSFQLYTDGLAAIVCSAPVRAIRQRLYVDETRACVDGGSDALIVCNAHAMTVRVGEKTVGDIANAWDLATAFVLAHVVFRMEYSPADATFPNWVQFLLNVHDGFGKFPAYFVRDLAKGYGHGQSRIVKPRKYKSTE
jgi:hypothetical protein